jgi:hypothetical protein
VAAGRFARRLWMKAIRAKLFLPGIDWKNEHRTSNIE